MITLANMFLPLAFLFIPDIDFSFKLGGETAISDISQNDGVVEFEIDTDYICSFETNAYPDQYVCEEERIGSDLLSIFVDIDDYKISQLREYNLYISVMYSQLIVNIDNYTVLFGIDYYIQVVAEDGITWSNQNQITREIMINTAEQFTNQQGFELNIIDSYAFDFAPRNQNNSIYYEGYEQGMTDQTQSEEIWQLFDTIFNVANNILSIEILPGIRLWYLVGIPVFFLLLQFILNLFR